MGSAYEKLIKNVEQFIRKYYLNKLIKGILYTFAALGTYFLIINFLEYYSWFSTIIRSVLFYSIVLLSVVIITFFIVIPIIKLFQIGKTLSHKQAAVIIGNHFPEVKDVLLNTLQLKELSENTVDNELIIAGIKQKTEQLSPFKFSNAVNLKNNLKYVKYALPPVLVILLMLILFPSFIVEPSKRIINHNTVFEKKAPFDIIITNTQLEVVQNDDFKLNIQLKGDKIPSELFVVSDNNIIGAKKNSLTEYEYTFKKVHSDLKFYIQAGEFNTKEYLLKVLPKPVIYDFDIQLTYPKYTGLNNETVSNMGDISVPEGTVAKWNFYTKDTEKLCFISSNSVDTLGNNKSNVFSKTMVLRNSFDYEIVSANSLLVNTDTLRYNVTTIPDLYPTISVQEYNDSIFDYRLYYLGRIKDDYGFSRLTFNFEINGADIDTSQVIDISIAKTSIQEDFYYTTDLMNLGLKPGDEISYYFEVFDNDEVNGAKSTKSILKKYKMPTKEELDLASKKRREEMIEGLTNSIDQTKNLKMDIDNLRKNLLNKPNIDWKDKQSIEQLMQNQQNIENQIKDIKQQNKENNLKESFREYSERVVEKQEELEKLLDKIMSDELKKLFEELQKMLDDIDKEKISDMLKNIEESSNSLEQELDRQLELFKQLELEKKFEQIISDLDKLSKEQKELSKETIDNKRKDFQETEEKQKEINSQFDKIKDDVKDLHKMNSELEEPNKLKSTEKETQDIDNELDNSLKEIQKKNKNKASESQNKASELMKQLSELFAQMKIDMEAEGLGEDIETMRRLLSNLITLSIMQEDNMKAANKTSTSDPKFPEIIVVQKNINDDMLLIKDSLVAMSKRQQSVERYILNEVTDVNNNINDAISLLNERNVRGAAVRQQSSMTGMNNLANMLADVLTDLQDSQMNCKSGKCNSGKPKPGAGKSGKIKSMRQLQEQLNKQLNDARNKMPGKNKKAGQQSMQNMSESLVRMAAQQEAIRRQMQQIAEEMQKKGTGIDPEIKKMLEDMEKTEIDIVNKNITQQTIERQQEILTRLLKSEKAEMEREKEERRESIEGSEIDRIPPQAIKEFEMQKKNTKEVLEKVPLNFTPFYKNKTEKYIQSFGNNNENR
ncbi:MAG: hypothetical protein PHP31_07390 [Lentimicrobiaceae bacterium]|nr:hypothetical protein [Lentimicrobiaceae bacterium]